MRRRLGILAALLALSCAVQAWMISRAVVPAQDAVRYVLMAQAYERDGLINALKSEAEHPLYPLLMWLLHAATERTCGAWQWATCAQWTAGIMLVISIVPLYLLLLRLVDESSALAGVLFFCVMTNVARLGADGLADSTQLALILGAMYCSARWWRSSPQSSGFPSRAVPNSASCSEKTPYGSSWWLLAVGVLIGLAMLARPEAAVFLPALVLSLGWLQLRRASRVPWLRLGAAATALTVGFASVQAAYAIATSSYSQEQLTARVLGRDQPAATSTSEPPRGHRTWRLTDGQPMEFGIKDRSVSSRFRGYASAAAELFRELPEAFQYWIGALALVGLWLTRDRWGQPFSVFAALLFVIHTTVAVHFSASLGYLSARHLVPLAPLALAPAGYAAVHVSRWLTVRRVSAVRGLGWAAVALAAIACLPRTLAALHPTRMGHRQAGEWLSDPRQAAGAVLDTRGWTALYSGRPTLRYDAAKAAYRRPDLAYVVVEERELKRDSARARTLVHLLNRAAERSMVFAAPQGYPGENVHVYRWFPERFTVQVQGLAAAAGLRSDLLNPDL